MAAQLVGCLCKALGLISSISGTRCSSWLESQHKVLIQENHKFKVILDSERNVASGVLDYLKPIYIYNIIIYYIYYNIIYIILKHAQGKIFLFYRYIC